MAPHFVFPLNLRALEKDEEEEYQDNLLSVQNPIDVATLRPSQLEEFVKGSSLIYFMIFLLEGWILICLNCFSLKKILENGDRFVFLLKLSHSYLFKFHLFYGFSS